MVVKIGVVKMDEYDTGYEYGIERAKSVKEQLEAELDEAGVSKEYRRGFFHGIFDYEY